SGTIHAISSLHENIGLSTRNFRSIKLSGALSDCALQDARLKRVSWGLRYCGGAGVESHPSLNRNWFRTVGCVFLATILILAAPAGAYTPVLRTIDSTGDVGAGSSIAVINGHIAVSYADDTNQRLKLWYDDGAGGGTA